MRTFVFAANYQHARYCMQQKGLNPNDRNVQYVHGPEVLRGIYTDDIEFIMYETFYDHPRWWEIYQQIKMIEAIRGSKVPTR